MNGRSQGQVTNLTAKLNKVALKVLPSPSLGVTFNFMRYNYMKKIEDINWQVGNNSDGICKEKSKYSDEFLRSNYAQE